jgi:hypothetical protein
MVSAKTANQPSLAELVRLEDLAGRPEPILHVLRNGWRSAPIVFGTSSLVPRQPRQVPE